MLLSMLSIFGFGFSYDLNNKVVIVTGASSGIGAEMVKQLDQAGARTVLAARRRKELQEVADTLSGEYLVVPTDICKENDCERLILKTIEKFGRIDVIVNNAGITQTTSFEQEQDLSLYHKTMEVNYFGTVNCIRFALPHVKKTKGMIVFVSSMCGKLGVPFRTAYCASKHAVHGFLDSLRTELLDTGVHILIACPGYVKTPIRALTSTTQDDPVNDTDIMSVDQCVQTILHAMKRKQREVYVVSTLVASFAPYIRWILPEYVDRATVRKQKGGAT